MEHRRQRRALATNLTDVTMRLAPLTPPGTAKLAGGLVRWADHPNGLSSDTPHGMKSATLQVATVSPWTNAQEAAAGTNPFDPNPPEGIVRPQLTNIPAVWSEPDENGDSVIVTPVSMFMEWQTIPGKQYTLLYSPDLIDWLAVPNEMFIGSGSIWGYGIEGKTSWTAVVGTNIEHQTITPKDGCGQYVELKAEPTGHFGIKQQVGTRIGVTYLLVLDCIKDGTIQDAVGESTNFLKDGSVPDPSSGYSTTNRLLPQPTITQTGRAGTSGILDPSSTVGRYGPQRNGVRFKFEGSAGNPIVNPSPAIDWNFDLAITVNNLNVLAPKWLLLGNKHDGFPAYEIYVRDSDGNGGDNLGTSIYQYDPIPLGRTPEDLFPEPAGVHETVSFKTGVIP